MKFQYQSINKYKEAFESENTEVRTQAFTEYFIRCKHHDWFFDFSDDHTVWRRGCAAQSILIGVAKEHPIAEKMYKAWQALKFERISECKCTSAGAPVLEDFLLNDTPL